MLQLQLTEGKGLYLHQWSAPHACGSQALQQDGVAQGPRRTVAHLTDARTFPDGAVFPEVTLGGHTGAWLQTGAGGLGSRV